MKRCMLVALTGIVCAFVGVGQAGPFDFSVSEIQLVESVYESNVQTHVDVTFDTVGNIHGVYADNRSGINHTYGRTFTANGELVMESYPTYDFSTIPDEPQTRPFVVPSIYSADTSYCMVVNIYGTSWQHQMASLNTAALPFTPTPQNLTSFSMNTSYSEFYDVISQGTYMFYCFSNATSIWFNQYDESVGSWLGETELIPFGNDQYGAPTMAIDDAGYVYVAYSVINPMAGNTYVKARRSVQPFDITSWHDERDVFFIDEVIGIEPHIAATGMMGVSLQTAITFVNPSLTVNTVIALSEGNEDWTPTSPIPYGSGPFDISSSLGPTVDVLGPDIDYDVNDDLYIVWADDRDMINRKLYGNYSDDGLNLVPEDEVFIAGIEDVREPPRIAFGDQVGDMAIGFIRHDGGLFNPYMLIKTTDFFDSCDNDPASTNFWDAYAGVIPVTSLYYSEPGCYLMSGVKGTLLRNYGEVEHQGSITLQFYDGMSLTEDFYVAVDNNNSKGVIRMLGVKNDTTSSSYSYFDGTNWLSMNAARSPGWHEIRFVVNNDGLVMQINEDLSKEIVQITDPSYTSFTSLEMDATGGSYFVDDILVETYPYGELEPRPIPSMSVLSLLLLLSFVGVLVKRR